MRPPLIIGLTMFVQPVDDETSMGEWNLMSRSWSIGGVDSTISMPDHFDTDWMERAFGYW